MADELSAEGVPSSGELESIVVPGAEDACSDRVAVELPGEDGICSGELDSTVVPGALLDSG